MGWHVSSPRPQQRDLMHVLCSTLICLAPWEVPLWGELGFPRQAAHLLSLLVWACSAAISNLSLAVCFGGNSWREGASSGWALLLLGPDLMTFSRLLPSRPEGDGPRHWFRICDWP